MDPDSWQTGTAEIVAQPTVKQQNQVTISTFP
jgi:hypothetical protein